MKISKVDQDGMLGLRLVRIDNIWLCLKRGLYGEDALTER